MIVKNLIAIGIGGALGTLCRYMMNVHTLWAGYPIGTIMENLIGSLLLGFITGWMLNRKSKGWLHAGISVGFCGGFTTMSTLAADTVLLTQESSVTAMITYLFISLFGGLILAFIGMLFGTKIGANRSARNGVG